MSSVMRRRTPGRGDAVPGPPSAPPEPHAAARPAPFTALDRPGPAPTSLTMRGLRTGAFAASSLALAVIAHRLGGGAVPGRVVAGAAAASLLVLGWALTGRERGARVIAGLVVTTQAALHVLFALTAMAAMPASARGSMTTAMWAQMLFCQHGRHPVTTAQIVAARTQLGITTPLATAAHAGSPLAVGAVLMLAAHLAAAGVMAWWLRRGERAAWHVAQRVFGALRPTLTTDPIRAVRVALTSTTRAWIPSCRVWGAGLAGRGPPVLATRSALTA